MIRDIVPMRQAVFGRRTFIAGCALLASGLNALPTQASAIIGKASDVRGKVDLVGFPVTLGDTALGPLTAPATLGEHSDAILLELGYSTQEIAAMRRDGAV